jgi:hypothetical protein
VLVVIGKEVKESVTCRHAVVDCEVGIHSYDGVDFCGDEVVKLVSCDIMCVSECQMQLAPSGNNDLSGNQLNNLIAAEVDAIVAVNPYFTVDHCVTACDALFNFFADDDEHKTDEQCRKACECKIDKNCDDHHGPGHHGPGHH